MWLLLVILVLLFDGMFSGFVIVECWLKGLSISGSMLYFMINFLSVYSVNQFFIFEFVIEWVFLCLVVSCELM